MDKRTREAVRYLGYGNHAVDDQTCALISDSFKELERIVKPRIVYRIFELKVTDKQHIKIADLTITSKNLAGNLKGCTQVILLGATLGSQVDLLIKRYSVTQIARSVVLQACAAAMLEEFLDHWQSERKREFGEEGYYLRPRFSPGYGDFSILHQMDLLRMLESAKKIGLTMTDSYMLTPTKSVTAVIGLARENIECHEEGCESCDKKDCLFRRNNE